MMATMMRPSSILITYSILIAIILYLIYQINTRDYNDELERNLEGFKSKMREQVPPILITMKQGFNPDFIMVPLGTKVQWVNLDGVKDKSGQCLVHKLVESNHYFESPRLDLNDSYAFRFREPGTYFYQCQNYPKMKGTIVVVDQETLPFKD